MTRLSQYATDCRVIPSALWIAGVSPSPLYAGKPPGYDRVRNAEIGNKDFELDVLEEAYTTEHWIVRIYKVKDLDNRGA